MTLQKPQKPTILAVDDVPANLVALEAVLAEDYNLLLANSGAEAIANLKANQNVSVILMDLQMPEMDGFEATSQIKKIAGCENIPVIFITAIYKEEPFVKKGYQAGGVDYFSKPFDPEILKMKVGIYASIRQKSESLKERERQLLETEELLRASHRLSSVLENLPVGVLISDIQGRICQTNGLVAKICGDSNLSDNELYGKMLGWWDANGNMIREQNGPLARALQKRESSHNEIMPISCAQGSTRKVLCSASPLLGLDEKLLGAVVVIQDITEPKKIEEDFEQRITKFISLGVELSHST
ncbi:MAG: response regulator [Bdellovibrionota bacterium]